jgi:phospholipid/cholesterol/gamma-HCH transport system permease protein
MRGFLLLAHPMLFPYTRRFLRLFAELLADFLHLIGLTVQNAVLCAGFLLRGRFSVRHFLEQAAFIGVDALGISLILTLFSGMVIALQIAQELTRQGAGEFVGALVSMAVLRELAPIMTGFAVIAMVGSAYSAELATMQIQKQVDALKVLQVHPVRYLILPRLCAGIVMMPMMTILTAMAGIVGGMVISYFIGDLNYNNYMESVWRQVQTKDIFGALLKAGVFGSLIVLLSTTIGLKTRGGAKEVGEATTQAVVWSFIAMAIADYILSFLIFAGEV